jgi:hypothetical protein
LGDNLAMAAGDKYLVGFGNHFASEAIPDTLPRVRHSLAMPENATLHIYFSFWGFSSGIIHRKLLMVFTQRCFLGRLSLLRGIPINGLGSIG